MSNETKKETKNNNIIFIAIGAVIILLIIGLVLIKGCSSNNSGNKENNEENTEVVKEAAKEEDLISAYGMSKENAIEIVKKIYNSDNYEFSCDINQDSKYVVSVKNLITNNVDKFIVDPTSPTQSFYMITE